MFSGTGTLSRKKASMYFQDMKINLLVTTGLIIKQACAKDSN